MSIFGSILSKIFGSHAAAATPATPAAGAPLPQQPRQSLPRLLLRHLLSRLTWKPC